MEDDVNMKELLDELKQWKEEHRGWAFKLQLAIFLFSKHFIRFHKLPVPAETIQIHLTIRLSRLIAV